MRRVLGFFVALVGLLFSGLILWRAGPVSDPVAALAVPDAEPGGSTAPEAPLAAPVAPLSEADRAARRLARYDRDKDGIVNRTEYLANRRKSFDKFDRNHDGRLDFEEFATATATKFARADRNSDGRLSPAEFATTAARRKPKAACVCPPPGEED